MSDETANASLRTPRKPEKPVLWIIAGPNGSGKSSLYNRTDIEGWGGSIWIINPDLLTARLAESEGIASQRANSVALDRIYAWLEASLDVYQTIGVETVLSSDKYRRLIALARERGFGIRMIYVVLRSADLQLERIRLRVREGGHDVPPEKVVSRRWRSFEQLAWFAKNVDECLVFDNSTAEPELIGSLKGDYLVQIRPMPRDMLTVLNEHGLETPKLNNPQSWHLI
jgi:predicted ABC-type ATPase